MIFANVVEKYSIPEPNSGCWLWLAGVNRAGYGFVRYKKKREYSNRASWMIYCGSIPSGVYVCHHCDNPACVNPQHLFLGTHKENMEDCTNKNRRAHGENHYYAKLTKEDVVLIRTSSTKNADLARRFGVDPSTISKTRSGIKWRHLL